MLVELVIALLVQDFVRSGVILLDEISLKYVGIVSSNWSKTAVDYSIKSAGSYYIDINNLNISPSNGPGHRYRGIPVRCLVIPVNLWAKV